ncbi:MAG: SLC13 family permease [Halolamina sp.]
MARARPVVLAGVAAAAVAGSPLQGLSQSGSFALATAAFAAVLWVTEGLPLPATALCVPILLTLFGVFPTMADALAGFADPIIFLLLAGFVLAAALQKHDLDRRVAFHLIGHLGSSSGRLVLAVMTATAGLSMVVSNSATTAMMIPVALGVADAVTDEQPVSSVIDEQSVGAVTEESTAADAPSNLETALLLGTAYAASIGGMGTLIGTPANAIVASVAETRLGFRIGFLDWLVVGLPLVVVSLPLAWLLLVRLYPPESGDATDARGHAEAELAAAGALSTAGRRTLLVTGATAGLWVLGGLGFLFEGALPPVWYDTLFGGAGSIVGAPHQGVLFYVLVGLAAVPVLLLGNCIEWDDVQGIDWGTLLLLGGGLALADGLAATDATTWLADGVVDALAGAPVVLVVLGIVAVTVLLSELASNTAVVAIFAPVVLGVGARYAEVLGTTPELAAVFLAVTVAIAASLGFALPVATPPNAIAFGTGAIGRREMLRAGSRLDLLLIGVTTALLLGSFRLLWPIVF